MRHVVHSPHVDKRRRLLLASHAHTLRHSLNLPQQMLWHAVTGSRLGAGFRREVVLLGRFIVDMLAPSVRLVVEIDGRCHERKRRADARRDRALASAGYHVLRLDAQLVLRNLPAAVERVVEAVARLRR